MVKSKKKTRGGGCGGSANKKSQPIAQPASSLQYGGNSFSIRNYYPAENYNNAPTNPNMITASRNLPNMQSGGKSRRIKKRKSNKTKKRRSHRIKKMVGGTVLFTTSTSSNPVLSFGNFDWASSGNNILSGTSNINAAPYSQPMEKIYGAHNAPLA